ncbi:DUF6892 domain-containing protein [Kribbella sp. CA-293567]|uniref:DUF6892 domain-containing protein n=1 Tax=Kribbella sp. CA-293567 TaxID=3002436 RepID=UPI0022DD79A3|nr:hypothetical protein [Kribbella sp. CA-293567]WBQ02186.1 hypothetical protein OX958_19565 [Kribbella sp. CA-293567]
MTDAGITSLEGSLAHLATLAADDRDGHKAVSEAWGLLVKADRGNLTRLYDLYFASVARLLGRPAPESALEGLDAYRFILTFATGRYLGAARRDAWNLLQQRHSEHRALIEAAQQHPDDRFTQTPMRLDTGTWGDIAGAMLELYSWHASYTGETEQYQAEIAGLVPAHFRAFPAQDRFVLLRLLAAHPEVVRETGELIRFYLIDRGQADGGPMKSLALDMLGFSARKGAVLHTRSAEIFAQVLRDVGEWPEATTSAFVERFVYYPLRIEDVTQADAAEAERRTAAVQRIAVSPSTRKTLTTAARQLPEAQGARVKALLEEAADYRSRPKRFPLPAPRENRFKDFGLKLLVIEELMYRQRVLEPRFDVHEFAQEYDKREISVEQDGYAIIPEVQRYFRNLAIPDELLARVETLHQSSGLDGGSEFFRHLFPFWDPGSGDEAIPVTTKAVADLDLLPNLTRISGLENSEPSTKLRKILTTRGIELTPEDPTAP